MFQFKFAVHFIQYGKSHFTKIESRAKSFAVCGNFDQKLDCLCVWMRPQSHLRIHHNSNGKNSTPILKPKTRIWKIGDILPRAYLACLFEWKLVMLRSLQASAVLCETLKFACCSVCAPVSLKRLGFMFDYWSREVCEWKFMSSMTMSTDTRDLNFCNSPNFRSSARYEIDRRLEECL